MRTKSRKKNERHLSYANSLREIDRNFPTILVRKSRGTEAGMRSQIKSSHNDEKFDQRSSRAQDASSLRRLSIKEFILEKPPARRKPHTLEIHTSVEVDLLENMLWEILGWENLRKRIFCIAGIPWSDHVRRDDSTPKLFKNRARSGQSHGISADQTHNSPITCGD